MEGVTTPITEHVKIFDENCSICTNKQRVLIEKYYIQRRPLAELQRVFAVTEDLLDLHARACGLSKKRKNNTAVLIDLILEQGVEKLKNGEFDMTLKDVEWAIGHRDKLLGRIKDKVEHNVLPVLVMHTTVPGVGGIANEDLKQIKQGKIVEKLDTEIKTLEATFEDQPIPAKETTNVGK